MAVEQNLPIRFPWVLPTRLGRWSARAYENEGAMPVVLNNSVAKSEKIIFYKWHSLPARSRGK